MPGAALTLVGLADDARHGQGRWVASTGDSYEGGWARGKRSGQGVCKTLMPDELEKERQRVSAELLVHREKHLMKIGRRPRGTAELTDVRGVSFGHRASPTTLAQERGGNQARGRGT